MIPDVFFKSNILEPHYIEVFQFTKLKFIEN